MTGAKARCCHNHFIRQNEVGLDQGEHKRTVNGSWHYLIVD